MTASILGHRAWAEQIMGIPVSIHLRGPSPSAARVVAVAAAFDSLRAVDAVFSTYQPESQISRLRRGELTPAECDDSVRAVLALCEEARVATDGYFDAGLPGPDGAPQLDPSGLVKGWATERVAEQLAHALGTDDRYVGAGGDIAVRCAARLSPWWRIGVEDPDQPHRVLGVLSLRGGGVATSGTAHRGSHIVDPHTGRPPTGVRAVTVVGPSLMWADVYATAAFARGADALDWLAAQDGYEALVVSTSGSLGVTEGMRELLRPCA